VDQWIIASEFAEVAVGIDSDANGLRLRLEDLRGGRVRYLDALDLEAVVWQPDARLQELLDPSAGRWSDEPRDE